MFTLFVLGSLLVHSLCSKYAIVIDAGSSSSKLILYKWDNLNSIEEMYSSKIKPGIEMFYGNLTGLRAEFTRLLNGPLDHIPSSSIKKTPVYLGATAGLRLLPEDQQMVLIDEVRTLVKEKFKYLFKERNIRVLSGEEEGVYGWNGIQYILENQFENTQGALDLGGASTQFTFIPKSEIIANKVTVTIENKVIDLYSHSLLRYGQDQAFKLALKLLIEENPENDEIVHPCLFTGYTYKDTESKKTFVGNSNVEECKQLSMKLLFETTPCFFEHCSINGVYVPGIQEDKEFVAFSGFYRVPQGLKLEDNKKYSINNLISEGEKFCPHNYTWAVENSGLFKEYVFAQCFNIFYATNILKHGYHINGDSEKILFSETLNEKTLSWSLGMLLSELQYLEIGKNDNLVNYYSVSTIILGITTVICTTCSLLLFIMNICLMVQSKKKEGFTKNLQDERDWIEKEKLIPKNEKNGKEENFSNYQETLV